MMQKAQLPRVSMFSQRAFTLLELLVALVIFAVIALTAWQLLQSSYKTQARGAARVQELQAVSQAYTTLVQHFAKRRIVANTPSGSTSANAATSMPVFEITGTAMRIQQQVYDIDLNTANKDPKWGVVTVSLRFVGDSLIESKEELVPASAPSAAALSNASAPLAVAPVERVLLKGIKNGKFRALTPDEVVFWPNMNNTSPNSNTAYPKGVKVHFERNDNAYDWFFSTEYVVNVP